MRSLVRSFGLLAFTALVFLVAFAGTALAAGAMSAEDGSLFDLLRPILDAAMVGNYPAAAALALVVGVALISKYGSRKWAFLGSGAGKALLTLGGAFFGALAAAFLAAGPGAALAAATAAATYWIAFKVALVAAGGYSLVKALLGPLVPKAPAWLRPILDLVLRFFDRPTQAAKEAEAAGDAAVAAKPPTGAAGVIGKSTEL